MDRREEKLNSKQCEGIVRTVAVHVSLQRHSVIHVLFFYCLLFDSLTLLAWKTMVSSSSSFSNNSSVLESVLMQSRDLYWARFLPGELERAGFIAAGRTDPVPGSVVKHCAIWHIPPRSQMGRFQIEAPAASSWWTEGERAERISQRENGRPCQGRGPPRPE